MKQLTEKEFHQRALMVMTFKSYYKYTFTYEGEYFKGKKVIAKVQCDGEDMYRTSLNGTEKLETFELNDCMWSN